MVRHQQHVGAQGALGAAGDERGFLRALDIAGQQRGRATIADAQHAGDGVGLGRWNVVIGRGRVQHLEVDAAPGPALASDAALRGPNRLQRMAGLDRAEQRGLRLHLHLGEAAFEGERTALGPVPGLDGVDGVGHGNDWHLANVPSFRALRALGFGASATAFVDRFGTGDGDPTFRARSLTALLPDLERWWTTA